MWSTCTTSGVRTMVLRSSGVNMLFTLLLVIIGLFEIYRTMSLFFRMLDGTLILLLWGKVLGETLPL